MTEAISADLCIIGAGSAGLSLAAGAAQLGRKVVLIEKGEMGGDCLNYGCVPSKALIAAASHAAAIRDARDFGVSAGDPKVDFAAVMEHVHSVIAAIAPHDSVERFEGFGVRVIRARAEFAGPRTVRAGEAEISAKHFVIATGSSPATPPITGLSETPHLTNETIFANRILPAHLIVIGGGPIGAELAQAHRRLGALVTIVDGQTILNREDPEAVNIVRKRIIDEGVAVRENVKIERVARSAGAITVTLAGGEMITGSHLLVAAGRRANLDGLGLEKAGVERDNGKLKLDARLRTTNKRIYAAGDAAGGLQFTHLAGDHASTLVRNILFKTPAKRRDALTPRATYCDPEIAAVGMNESEARAADPDVRTVKWPLKDNDRAQAERDTDGFIKVFARKNGRILGALIVGRGAGDLIGLWSFALANRLKISAMTSYIAPYPTRGEISKRAGGAFYTPALFSDRTRAIVKLLATFD
ncbi:MAG: FAD-dependent oxidoreductase [Parvularculaceae bacterium]|nr:FAD-dependent oxidoreductase [Parvularculaceae bacterium]